MTLLYPRVHESTTDSINRVVRLMPRAGGFPALVPGR